MTNEQIEIAARKLCEIRKFDWAIWTTLFCQKTEIIRHIQVHEAINFAVSEANKKKFNHIPVIDDLTPCHKIDPEKTPMGGEPKELTEYNVILSKIYDIENKFEELLETIKKPDSTP